MTGPDPGLDPDLTQPPPQVRSLATGLDASTARLTAELHATGPPGAGERMMADDRGVEQAPPNSRWARSSPPPSPSPSPPPSTPPSPPPRPHPHPHPRPHLHPHPHLTLTLTPGGLEGCLEAAGSVASETHPQRTRHAAACPAAGGPRTCRRARGARCYGWRQVVATSSMSVRGIDSPSPSPPPLAHPPAARRRRAHAPSLPMPWSVNTHTPSSHPYRRPTLERAPGRRPPVHHRPAPARPTRPPPTRTPPSLTGRATFSPTPPTTSPAPILGSSPRRRRDRAVARRRERHGTKRRARSGSARSARGAGWSPARLRASSELSIAAKGGRGGRPASARPPRNVVASLRPPSVLARPRPSHCSELPNSVTCVNSVTSRELPPWPPTSRATPTHEAPTDPAPSVQTPTP